MSSDNKVIIFIIFIYFNIKLHNEADIRKMPPLFDYIVTFVPLRPSHEQSDYSGDDWEKVCADQYLNAP